MSSLSDMSAILQTIIEMSGGQSPAFTVITLRDFWYLRRGPKWRYPLPRPRTFAARKSPSFEQRRQVFHRRKAR